MACPVSQCARSRSRLVEKELQRLLPEPRREEPCARNHWRWQELSYEHTLGFFVIPAEDDVVKNRDFTAAKKW
ncbi:hypothetical protein VZT92_024295 [Zoarces viviparus]|uniref:Uncharacterized protein n=1 Tax=Zoarces viviparus TaxID=48416 RepID=A0AAW1E3H8_ZOAVI